jgi:hypothetical protein
MTEEQLHRLLPILGVIALVALVLYAVIIGVAWVQHKFRK